MRMVLKRRAVERYLVLERRVGEARRARSKMSRGRSRLRCVAARQVADSAEKSAVSESCCAMCLQRHNCFAGKAAISSFS